MAGKETFGAWLIKQAGRELDPAAAVDDQLAYLAAVTWAADEGKGKTRSVDGVTKRMSGRPDWEQLRVPLQAAVSRFQADGQTPPGAGTPPEHALAPQTVAEGQLPGAPAGETARSSAGLAAAAVHPYAGSNPARQGAGSPGHCGMCADEGHVKAHPDAGCSDVGCHVDHSAVGPDSVQVEEAGPDSGEFPHGYQGAGDYDGLTEGTVTASGPGKSPVHPVLAAEAEAFVYDAKVAGQALEALEFVNRWREFMAGPADDDETGGDLILDAVDEAGRLLAIAGQALLDAAAALAGVAAPVPAQPPMGDGQGQGGPGRENGSESRNPALEVAQRHGWTSS
jgi:hypothetical protein